MLPGKKIDYCSRSPCRRCRRRHRHRRHHHRGTPITIIFTNAGSTIHLIVLLIIILLPYTSIMSQACFFAKQNGQYALVQTDTLFINKRQKVHLPDCTEIQPTRPTDSTTHLPTHPTNQPANQTDQQIDQSFDQSRNKKEKKREINDKKKI